MKGNYLVITPLFPSDKSFRGPFVYDQVRELMNATLFNVIVLRPNPFYSGKKDYLYEGVNVCYFKSWDLPFGFLQGMFSWISVISLKNKLKQLNISINEISVIHSHVIQQGYYANALKILNPSIYTILQHHGFDVLGLTNGWFSRFAWHRNWVQKSGIKKCNKIDLHIGVSRKTLEYLENVPGIRMKDRYVLYNGVDQSKFFVITGLKDPRVYTIGCIGNFWTIKDQITLVKAVELLIKNESLLLRVIFVGTGETRPLCEGYISDNGLAGYFEFIDSIPHHELNQFYNRLNLFVLPSYYEAFGCVYAEAYSCGVPYIAVKGQGIEEILPPDVKEKFLIDKGDFVRLAGLIKYFWQNDVELPKLEIDISHLVKNFVDKKLSNII